MSKLRRKLFFKEAESAKLDFTKVIQKINSMPGFKCFLKKFDDSPFVWIMSYTSSSATSVNIHVLNLDGDIIASKTLTGKRWAAVCNNILILSETTANYSCTLSTFKLEGNLLIKIKTSPVVGNYLDNKGIFMYISSSGEMHFSAISTLSRTCSFDYNISTNTVTRVESNYDRYFSAYHYDGAYLRGLVWSMTSGQLCQAGYFKDTEISAVRGNNYTPSINSYYWADFKPLFNHTGSINDIDKEMFVSTLSRPYTLKNVIGLNTLDTPGSITTGAITLTDRGSLSDTSGYDFAHLGFLSYTINDQMHMYSYNLSTKLVDEVF